MHIYGNVVIAIYRITMYMRLSLALLIKDI